MSCLAELLDALRLYWRGLSASSPGTGCFPATDGIPALILFRRTRSGTRVIRLHVAPGLPTNTFIRTRFVTMPGSGLFRTREEPIDERLVSAIRSDSFVQPPGIVLVRDSEGMPVTRRQAGIGQAFLRVVWSSQDLLFHCQIGFEVNLCGLHRLVSQPKSDYGSIDA